MFSKVLRNIVALLATAASISSHATPVIDQSNIVPNTGGIGVHTAQRFLPYISAAQSFTAGKDGLLTSFGVTQDSFSFGSADVYLRDSINGENLAHFLLQPSPNNFTAFDTSLLGIDMTAGEDYFIVVLPTSQNSLYLATSNSYSGGTAYFSYDGLTWNQNLGTDLIFSTFVDQKESSPVPEPSSMALIGIALTGLVWNGRKKSGAAKK